jgi:hypothetical protein
MFGNITANARSYKFMDPPYKFETTNVRIVWPPIPDLSNDLQLFYNYFRTGADLYFILQNAVADEVQKQNKNN